MHLLLLLLLFTGCDREVAPEPVRYEVVRGDTLGRIAKAHGVTVAQLRGWNGIEGDLIEVGQVLRIEAAAQQPGPTAAPRVARAPREPREPATPARARPKPKPCLAGPTLDEDEGAVASEGLDEAQIRAAMQPFLQQALDCVPPRSGRVRTTITAGCDGVVSRVTIDDDGGYPPEAVDCLREALLYVAFPAHALPDGDTFGYPLRFDF